MDSLRDRLRRGTREQHQGLESRPFFVALLGETLELDAYVAWLRALTTVIGALDGCLREVEDSSIQALRFGSRLDLLRADAAVHDDVPMPDGGLLAPTLELVERLRGFAAVEPRALVGALYVFEGAALGARVQWPHLTRFERGGAGARYLAALAEESETRWKTFTARLDELPFTARDEDVILDVARQVFEGLAAIAEALDPGRADPQDAAASTLNAEAGRHGVSHDPREVLAAVDAGITTWEAYPYYAARYGERGRSFTRSDSAWLVTLVEARASEAERHLIWLTRLLAVRGMPSLLLEDHLRHLHDALCEAVPERTARYAWLGHAAESLADRRLQAVPGFAELAASFAGRGEPGNVGPLIVCAVADEYAGIEGAVPALVDWLQTPDRFEPAWIAAVGDLLTRAKRAAADGLSEDQNRSNTPAAGPEPKSSRSDSPSLS